MYNQEIKEQFIKQQYNNYIDTQEKALYTFKKTAVFEEKYGIDLMEFNLVQIIDLLKSLGCRTAGSLAKHFNIMKQYVIWAENNYKLCKPNKAFNSITRNDIRECINAANVQDQYIKDRNELYTKVVQEEIHNDVDRAIIVLLYEGVFGEEAAELLNLKKEDVNFENREIYIKQGNVRTISNINKQSMDILKKAVDQKIYENANGESTAKAPNRDLVQSDYIIRPIYGYGDKMDRNGLMTKFARFKEWTKRKYIKATSIHYSGIFDTLREIELDENRELNTQDYHKVLNIYGMNPSLAAQTREKYEYLRKKNIF